VGQQSTSSEFLAPVPEPSPAISEPSAESSEPPVMSENIQTNMSAPFLKLGRWESTAESASGDLQFGSFGSYKEEPNAGTAGSTWGTDNSGDARAMDSNWGNGAQGSVNIPSSQLNSYFPPGKSLSSAPGSGSFDASKSTAPPPGLDNQGKVSGQVGRNSAGQHNRNNKGDLGQGLQQQNAANQYYQGKPPGILAPGRGLPPTSQYQQYGFDASQTPFMHPGFQPLGSQPGALGANAAATAPTSSSATSATQQASTQQQQAQPQAQQFTPPPGMAPYYFSPYFHGQYFYGQQGGMQNYYQQGRGVYPSRGPYPNDPYGAGAPMYPDMYQQGQFGDAGSAYGNLPIHPAMPMPGQQSIASAGSIGGSTGGKQTKGASAVGTAPSTASQDPAAASQHAPYGYAPYGRNDQWQYQQGAGQWGGMMPFPAPSSAVPAQTGAFTQPVGGATQSQQNNATGSAGTQRATPSNSAYGSAGTFAPGNRNTGAGAPSW
jgi:hypothetical protein